MHGKCGTNIVTFLGYQSFEVTGITIHTRIFFFSFYVAVSTVKITLTSNENGNVISKEAVRAWKELVVGYLKVHPDTRLEDRGKPRKFSSETRGFHGDGDIYIS
jgi:hypothetical protein